MFDIKIKNNLLMIDNCDKDGTLVAKRIASLSGLVAPTRNINIDLNRETDETFAQDMADKLASLYKNSKSVNKKIIIFSSVHRYALYLAEVLNAVVLPLQIISFAKSWEQAKKTQTTSICGTDSDRLDLIWQWNKFTSPEHFPKSYVELMKNAEEIIIVRSTDRDDDPDNCQIVGKYKNLYINTTLLSSKSGRRHFKKMQLCMDTRKKNFIHLGQWEWSLPNDTINATKQIWESLGKDTNSLHTVKSSTINLYKRIIPLWEEYLKINNIPVRGFSFNPYFTCHPYYEKLAGLLPINYYKFEMVSKYAEIYIRKYAKQIERTPRTITAFTNEFGSDAEIQDLQCFLEKFGMSDTAWLSNGSDCSGDKVEDFFGKRIPAPYLKVQEWIKDAPYKRKKFIPMKAKDALVIK